MFIIIAYSLKLELTHRLTALRFCDEINSQEFNRRLIDVGSGQLNPIFP